MGVESKTNLTEGQTGTGKPFYMISLRLNSKYAVFDMGIENDAYFKYKRRLCDIRIAQLKF